MGQGYSSTTLPAGPSAIETPELADLTFERVLGGARFLRTVRAKHKNGVVIVKVCMKSNANVSFKKYSRILKAERRALLNVPNVLTYQRILETNAYGILVRQFIHNSLYDRISVRPFLEVVEKKWIAFQLICAVRDCHSRSVFHGDIKSENVLVTSWGWAYLTDFSSAFKPVYLPEDNPADFSFYFDTAARRTCYLAPERFLAGPRKVGEDASVQWNMDIFSLGCVIAELFTEAPIFTLSQLFKYRKGEYDPTVLLLNKIDDEHIRALISSMIRLDPGERWHAQDYLDEYKSKAFPLYFYQHLHTLMEEITDPTSGLKPVVVRETNNAISDDRIERIYTDFEMLSVSLGYHISAARPQNYRDDELFPMQIDLPNARQLATRSKALHGDNGTLILLNVVTSSIRNAARATSKIHACELMLAFAARLPDEAKLDRVLPYIMPLLEDTHETVLMTALRTMTQLLALVEITSPVNSFLFTQYIFPRLQMFVNTVSFKRSSQVRATYASCLACLAETASRFLSMIQALRADGSLPTDHSEDDGTLTVSSDTFDATRAELMDQFEAQTKVFLTDNDTAVRRAFLSSVPGLCVFFNEAKAADVILSHLNTYLNDSDWLLKRDLFKTIVAVSVYVGGASIEDFILPLMLQALTDPQDFVVEQALRSLASMAELGLLQRPKTWELIDTIARFTMHPNLWIREAATHFVTAAITFLSVADIRILVTPLIAPYLKIPVSTLSESELLDSLRKPLPRIVLDMAMSWATRTDRGVFWRSAKDSRRLSYHGLGQIPPTSSVAELMSTKALARVPKTDEDEQQVARLRSAGMHSEDEFKFLAFREYIWRIAKRKIADDTKTIYDDVVNLSRWKVTPHTILFDNDPAAYNEHISATRGIYTGNADPSVIETLDGSKVGDNERSPSARGQLALPGGKRPSDNLSSSPGSGTGLLKDVDRALRHRDSRAILPGTELRSKAVAEVATTDASAIGKLEAPKTVGDRSVPTMTRPSVATRSTSSRSIHNYEGSDPSVLRLLDNVYADNFPVDVAEFGPIIQQNKRGPIVSSGGLSAQGAWRPQGKLVAVLNEHTSRVSKLIVSPDHTFFLSGSDDGSVKVWDTERLEKNISHRSRATYRLATGASVTSMCFVDSTHTFICASSDGRIHVVRVDVSETGSEQGQTTKYGKLKVLREWQIPSEHPEYAVCIEHMRGDTMNVLVLATNMNRIMAVDLRTMSLLFEFTNPAQHGSVTAFCIGRKQDWLLIGTSQGVLDLWDLRFQLKLRSWSFPSASPIARLQLHPSRKAARRNKVCISGGTKKGEVSIWDIEKVICTEVYRPTPSMKDKIHFRDYELRNLEDERAENLLGRVVESAPDSTDSAAAGIAVAILSQQSSTKDVEVQLPFVVTGGPDNRVRFWDPDRLEACKVVGAGATEQKPSYTISTLGLDTRIISERSPESQITAGALESNKVGDSSPSKRGQSTPAKLSRYDQIRLSAQQLLNGHLDAIADVAMVERPFGMIVSADRAGQILVHQ